ncbi:MAG: FliI/YscN family ATPase [Deltaproteobacteria bacterium]|nr:FliI/YscN family ATPase [Deltaproteobacteria bacterium]
MKFSFNQIDWRPSGKVTDVVGTVVEAHLPGSRLGTVVSISVRGQGEVLAEVVGFTRDKALLIPYSSLSGIAPGCAVSGKQTWDRVAVGDYLLGRVVDPLMNPLEGDLQLPERPFMVPLEKEAPNPLRRARVADKFQLGIRAMDSLLTFGEGQRVGIMAGSGVGKSVLMGMIARGSAADVNVIGLVGERGREVREFIERDLGPEGLARSVVVCSTSDQSPLMRLRAARATTAIAEAFSAQGKRVLLMMDSLTRVAMAQREIGLAIGEPPTTKGYPPSVFALLPRLLERCGPQVDGQGSISGLYTVLVDGDDFNDPIPDAVRSILDGHINLSRSLAARGHFPAIDVTTSTSRVMRDIVDDEHWGLASTLRQLLGVYQENIDLIQVGAYQQGTNPTLEAAIAMMPTIEAFLRQDINERSTLREALQGMRDLFNRGR